MKLLDQNIYVQRNGTFCPLCDSDDVEGGPVEIDGNTATQEISCNECWSNWTDIYDLGGYTNFTKGEKP